MRLLRSPQTAVHLVTLLEEMPVQETLDAVAELTAAGLPVGGVVVNAVRDAAAARRPSSPPPRKGRLDRGARSPPGSRQPGVDAGRTRSTALLAEAAEHAERVALEKAGAHAR